MAKKKSQREETKQMRTKEESAHTPAQAERADSAAPIAAHSDAGGARATPSAAKAVQPPSTRDGYYFKKADGRVQGPLSADKFEW